MIKRRSVSTLFVWLALALAIIPLALAAAREPQPAWQAKVDAWVLQRVAESGRTEALIYLAEQADLRDAATVSDKVARGQYVFETLSTLAETTQASLRAELEAQNIPYRSYWIANMIWVELDGQQLAALASRADVAHVYANPSVALQLPAQPDPFAPLPDGPDTIEWNIAKINAPAVWQMGYDGTGVVVGGQDTGYEWEHPALKDKYRGWDGAIADHNYSWHDAIHSGGGVCGADSAEPCDDHDHGTHTMGTMVGDDGGSNQIGVAPGAKWIGCRNMDQGNGTPTTYSECFQWFVAPTDLNDENPNPALAPDVINNSWGCPPSEGCTDPTILQTVVENTRAAGILVVTSAGNSGPSCSTVANPPGIYDASFAVGSTTSTDAISGFSSRGPVTVDGSNRPKPDISAPGSSVRSSVRGGGYGVFSGTSMAAPHVVGLTALLIDADASLQGDTDGLETAIIAGALGLTSAQTCGGVSGSTIPNNTFGHGRIDAQLTVLLRQLDPGNFLPIVTRP